ncbi:MAG: hypothetical protein AAFY24_01910 [Pseudomonadota bacterium]
MNASVRYRENQRYIVRGLSFDTEQRTFKLDMEEDETRKVTFNFNDTLDTGQTIDSATISEASGITASVSLTSNIATLTLSALSCFGRVEMTVTRSDGQIFKVYLEAEAVITKRRDRHYYWRHA